MAEANGVEVWLPIKTGSGLNDRMHYFARSRQVKQHRKACLAVPKCKPPCTVVLTRHSAGSLDGDNLQGALKAVRDGIADRLGVQDNDPRVTWLYAQERCKRGQWGVLVAIQERP